MRRLIYALAVMTLVSCGGGGGGSGGSAATAAPTNFKATGDANSATLSWSLVNGAQKYHVYYAAEPDQRPANYSAYTDGTWLQDVSSPLVINNLDQGPIYYFIVTAVKDGVESAPSRAQAVTRYRYEGGSNEVVFDTSTNLEWQRCSVGQTWNNTTKTCDGTATMHNTTAALAYLSPDSNGWRLSSESELMGLMYSCLATPVAYDFCEDSAPHIDGKAFPNTPYDRAFHTSTPTPGGPVGMYQMVNFSSGTSVGAGGPAAQVFVRLVRTATP